PRSRGPRSRGRTRFGSGRLVNGLHRPPLRPPLNFGTAQRDPLKLCTQPLSPAHSHPRTENKTRRRCGLMSTVRQDADWISTRDRLPEDGQRVWVKTQYGVDEHPATFMAHPVPRWENGSTV